MEQNWSQVDGVPSATHALVGDGTGVNGSVSTLDVDGATTVWVAIGLRTHEREWKRNDGCVIVNDRATSAITFIQSVSIIQNEIEFQDLPPAPL